MRAWTYGGQKVFVPRTADIPTPYRLGGCHDNLVQRALDKTPRWDKGEDPIEEITVERELVQIVVPTLGAPDVWAKHRGHRAKNVGLSPFVEVRRSFTHRFTVELAGTPEQPKVVRAYPGDYIPPLPWMRTAKYAYGGVEECVDFWRGHAYVLTPGVVAADSETDTAPDWFIS